MLKYLRKKIPGQKGGPTPLGQPPKSALDEINEKVLFLCPVLYKNFYTFEYI